MVVFQTLDDFLQELMLSPNEIFVHFDQDKCAVYIPDTEEFLFLDGDFSGSVSHNKAQLRRLLRKMGYV